jgi:hypothetical protein
MNTVLTLHYVPDKTGKPAKDAPQRRLVREARSGKGFDLVICRRGDSIEFQRMSTFDEWQSMVEQAEKDKDSESLYCEQQNTLEAVKTKGDWMTRREVCVALGRPWSNRGRNPEARLVEKWLARLVTLKLLESQRKGKETVYRLLSCDAPGTKGTRWPLSDDKGCTHGGQEEDKEDQQPPELGMSPKSQLDRDKQTPSINSRTTMSTKSEP